jgi:hypothetical protein
MTRRVTSTVHAPADRWACGPAGLQDCGTAGLRDCDNGYASRWRELGATKAMGPGERKDGTMGFATVLSLPVHSY